MPADIFSYLRKASLKGVWLSMAVVLLALPWLLPNHTHPWAAFHTDAGMAVALLMLGAVITFKSDRVQHIPRLTIAVLFLALIPIMQFHTGMLAFAGQAWMAALFLLTLSLAVALGYAAAVWDQRLLVQVLAASLAFASVSSCLIQLVQWLGMVQGEGLSTIWLTASSGHRPAANLSQPNHLASLHLWGLLSALLLLTTATISRHFALCISMLAVMGLALTQSRIGILGLLLTVFIVWKITVKGHPLVRGRDLLLVALIFLIVLFGQGPLAKVMLLEGDLTLVARSSGELRPRVWQMFGDAAMQKPWLGYGWADVTSAQLAVGHKYPEVTGVFAQSHNLFLDLVLWVGAPLGLLLTVCILTWLARVALRVNDAVGKLCLAMVLVIGLHAMVELPLHYGHFLWPTGLLLGLLAYKAAMPVMQIPKVDFRPALFTVICAVSICFYFVLTDYLSVEQTLSDLRIERNRVIGPPVVVPEVVVLNQLNEQFWLIRYEPYLGMSQAEIKRVASTAESRPMSMFMFKNTQALAFGGRTDEAQRWMCMSKSMVNPEWMKIAAEQWATLRKQYPQLAPEKWACTELPP